MRRRFWIRWITIIAAGALFAPGLRLVAAQRRKSHHARRAAVHRRRRHYRRHYRHRHHYYRLHLSRARARQIQEALVKAGFLNEKPDGIWGPSTRAAMRKYQKANGFSPTGLPEAKPLMKLGLGPHPLAPGLEPLASTDAKGKTASQDDTSAAVSAPQKSSTSSTQ